MRLEDKKKEICICCNEMYVYGTVYNYKYKWFVGADERFEMMGIIDHKALRAVKEILLLLLRDNNYNGIKDYYNKCNGIIEEVNDEECETNNEYYSLVDDLRVNITNLENKVDDLQNEIKKLNQKENNLRDILEKFIAKKTIDFTIRKQKDLGDCFEKNDNIEFGKHNEHIYMSCKMGNSDIYGNAGRVPNEIKKELEMILDLGLDLDLDVNCFINEIALSDRVYTMQIRIVYEGRPTPPPVPDWKIEAHELYVETITSITKDLIEEQFLSKSEKREMIKKFYVGNEKENTFLDTDNDWTEEDFNEYYTGDRNDSNWEFDDY